MARSLLFPFPTYNQPACTMEPGHTALPVASSSGNNKEHQYRPLHYNAEYNPDILRQISYYYVQSNGEEMYVCPFGKASQLNFGPAMKTRDKSDLDIKAQPLQWGFQGSVPPHAAERHSVSTFPLISRQVDASSHSSVYKQFTRQRLQRFGS